MTQWNIKEIAHTDEMTKNLPDYVDLASFGLLFWFYDSQVLVCFILTTLLDFPTYCETSRFACIDGLTATSATKKSCQY